MEYLDIVDAKDRVVGRALREQCHGNPDLIHRAVHVFLFNGQGDLFLQKRAANKDIAPDRWDASVGGHVAAGESWMHAAQRELQEEMDIGGILLNPLYTYLYRNPVESEMIRSYSACWEGPFRLNAEEISDGKFWTIEDIRRALGKDVLTPNFEWEYRHRLESELPLLQACLRPRNQL
jgi:isopentenyl-diphosphate delta-isomerase type 1